MLDKTDLWAIPLLAALWGVNLWYLWRIGGYAMTGAAGWRRIIAGWRLMVLVLEQKLIKCIAMYGRRRR